MTSWFFIEMAAKSALICGIALLLGMALRHRAAADRATVLRVGVILLLALPLIDLAFPVLEVEAFAASAAPAMNLSAAEMQQLLLLADTLPPVEASIWDDPAPLILLLWAAGALAVLGRLAIGLATLRRWTRSAEPATDPVWTLALERARSSSGAPDNLRLMVADHVPGPLGWGWRNPVILIDYDTYAEGEEADAILAHEVAHVARRDWPALMLTRIATALFWFNPLIWTLARETVQQAEEAADAHAARLVDPTRYAETLLTWGQIGRGIGVPANSIAPGASGLSRRVRAVLEPGLRDRSAGSRMAMAAVILCVGIAAPVAALELVEAARPAAAAAPEQPVAAAALAQPATPQRPAAPSRADEPAGPADPDDIDLTELGDIEPAMAALREVLPRIPHTVAHAMKAVDPEQIARAVEASRVHGVSGAQIEAALARARAHMPDEATLRARIRHIDPVELEARIRAAMPDEAATRARVRTAMAAHRNGMAQGARGMEIGAQQMERGAAKMEQSARRFRDPAERERIIARERARGRTVTHEDLLEAAEGMEEGARGMREGAQGMREGAREMLRND